MLFLNNIPLPEEVSSLLEQYQKEVDGKPSFPEKVEAGKVLFSKYNRITNPAFKMVRNNLSLMSGGTIRCNYCEDSHANQVEHIHPKHFYPEKCFSWFNYCYACNTCNQPKSNLFSVFAEATGNEINLKNIPRNTPPPAGHPLLVSPRTDNPLDYLFLDTLNSFRFVPLKEDETNFRRAEYTIEILGLNTRNYLIRARKVAFSNFKARLFEYVARKKEGATANELIHLIVALRSEHHQTVWHEMIRQRILHPEVNELFEQAPEALNWI